MKNRLQLIVAALSIAAGALLLDASSAQAQNTFPDCWWGAWSAKTSTTTTCSNSIWGYGISARVTNRDQYGALWRRATINRISNCNLGHAFLWINSTEWDPSSGQYIEWWWRNVNTIRDCTTTLTRDPSINGRMISRSACNLEICTNQH